MPISQFPKQKVAGVTEITESLINVIKKNMIAKTELTSDGLAGQTTIYVTNAFQFRDGEEIVLIDYDYDLEGEKHYAQMEYAKIKTVVNTTEILLESALQDSWYTAKSSFIQKTIGHSPLIEKHVYYGDREVISTEYMAITIEPVNLSNEWMYLQGGLNETYQFKITIYGKSLNTDDGKRIIDKYADAVYQLLIDNLHFAIDNYDCQLQQNASIGDTQVVILDTPKNREMIKPYTPLTPEVYEYPYGFMLQDNYHTSCWIKIDAVTYSGGFIYVDLERALTDNYTLNEYAVLRRFGRYVWDSRADGIEYGAIQKGSAFIRAAQINWFCKSIRELKFPQASNHVDYLPKVNP